jgi:hypothetical protein
MENLQLGIANILNSSTFRECFGYLKNVDSNRVRSAVFLLRHSSKIGGICTNKIIADKMTIDKMTVNKMTSQSECRQNDCRQ